MKKKVILKVSILLLAIVTISSYIYLSNKNGETIDKKKQQIKNTNLLTMMLETEAGTGIYEETIASEWPTDGYVFNTNLSKCENGGIVFWDDKNKVVKMKSNISDKCYLYFDKYNKAELNVSVNKDDSSITVTVTSTDEITKYYYSKDGGSNYVESTNNTYTFTNLDNDTSYQIKIYGIDSNGQTTKEYNETIKTDDILTLVNYITSTVYTTDGVNGLYYHDGVGTYTNANQEAGDKSYRYSGANPNNYVCFGSDAATCPHDNLYRIIGLFDDDQDGIYNIKLIKHDYANDNLLGTNGDYGNDYGTLDNYYKGNWTKVNGYYWNNSTANNNWSESNLNKTNLNTNFWNNFANNWQQMINLTLWQVGGNSSRNIDNYTVKTVYQNELIRPDKNMTYKDEIGLMYVSDYGYAASPENWQTILSNYDNDTNRNNNWLFMGLMEWFITPRSDMGNITYVIYEGDVFGTAYVTTALAIRPTFYLKSNVQLVSGNGTITNPYRLAI